MHAPILYPAPPNANLRITALAPILAVEFCRLMRGASHPVLVRGENDKYYVVKLRNFSQHPRALANELLAAELARLIELPVPEPAFVQVPSNFLIQLSAIESPNSSRCLSEENHLHFGSSYPGVPGRTLVVDFLPRSLLRRQANLAPLFAGAFLFDVWTFNRHARKMLFFRLASEEGSPYSACLIHHGFCFNGNEWDFPSRPVYTDFPRTVILDNICKVSSFEPFLSRIETLKAWEIERCAQNVPREWCGEEPQQIHRLVELLCKRARRVRQAVVDAVNAHRQLFRH